MLFQAKLSMDKQHLPMQPRILRKSRPMYAIHSQSKSSFHIHLQCCYLLRQPAKTMPALLWWMSFLHILLLLHSMPAIVQLQLQQQPLLWDLRRRKEILFGLWWRQQQRRRWLLSWLQDRNRLQLCWRITELSRHLQQHLAKLTYFHPIRPKPPSKQDHSQH